MNKKPLLYKMGVFFLGFLFKIFYNPKIIGKENIPDKGPVIIAGNHVHLYDQCHVLISTKRYINYMAKKEYFSSKLTSWFFKNVGCIKVDRTKKDDLAVNEALGVLNRGGALGIFPEGTRNALKKDEIKILYSKYFNDYSKRKFKSFLKKNTPKKSQVLLLEKLYNDKKISLECFYNSLENTDKCLKKLLEEKIIDKKTYDDSLILDFKYGAVSLASKTKSVIIPVVVTGTYKFRSNNLTVKIGKSINVDDKDLKEANLNLRKTMIEMIKEI